MGELIPFPGPRRPPRASLGRVESTPEMELILALIAALAEKPGLRRLAMRVLQKLTGAMGERRFDPALHGAVNALCSPQRAGPPDA